LGTALRRAQAFTASDGYPPSANPWAACRDRATAIWFHDRAVSPGHSDGFPESGLVRSRHLWGGCNRSKVRDVFSLDGRTGRCGPRAVVGHAVVPRRLANARSDNRACLLRQSKQRGYYSRRVVQSWASGLV
jgi:hypothetical protein